MKDVDTTTLDNEQLEHIVESHGHMRLGLAMGIQIGAVAVSTP